MSVDLYLSILRCFVKREFIEANLNKIGTIDFENDQIFLELDKINIGVLAKETLENYEETNPDRLDPFTLKSNCNKVLINARIYLIEMAKQIRQCLDFNDERLKYSSALSPYSFCLEYFRRLICHFKF